jgi:omega-amidase
VGEGAVLVGLVSLDQAWEDKEANLAQCRLRAARAAAAGARLVVFPEMTLTGFTMNSAEVVEDGTDSATIRAFVALAAELDVHIAFGVVLAGAVRPRNCLVVVGPEGELARYAKLHPFSHAGEDAHYEGGDELATVAIDGVRIGLTVCYDLRFPELYSALAPQCDAVLVIANWPAPRISHWHALLRARAIDSQCYVIAVNRTGRDANGIEYPASSQVISPRGEAVSPLETADALDVYEVAPQQVARYRAAFPSLKDRRPELYRRLQAREPCSGG